MDKLKLTVVESEERPNQTFYLIEGFPVGLFYGFCYEGPKDASGRPTYRASLTFDPNAKGFK